MTVAFAPAPAAFAPAPAAPVVESIDAHDNDIVGEVCADCLMLVANGEVDDADTCWNQAAALATLAEFYAALGDESTPFATTACEVCDTTLAGYRHEVVLNRR